MAEIPLVPAAWPMDRGGNPLRFPVPVMARNRGTKNITADRRSLTEKVLHFAPSKRSTPGARRPAGESVNSEREKDEEKKKVLVRWRQKDEVLRRAILHTPLAEHQRYQAFLGHCRRRHMSDRTPE